jgi:DNA-binding beta-propeller fold protein YncE
MKTYFSESQGLARHTHQTGISKASRRSACLAAACTALAVCMGGVSAFGAVSVSPDIAYFYGSGPGEGMSVSSDGLVLMVSSPVAGPVGSFTSSVPQAVHAPWTPEIFFPFANLQLGQGESTDVAVVPNRLYGLVVVRGDTVNTHHALHAIRGERILQSIPIPDSPDGMKVTPDGRYAIVAVEKGGDIRIYDLLLGPGRIRMVARVTRAAIAAYFVGVPNPVDAAEPEAIAVASDSSFALVTLQDCASVVAVDLNVVRRLGQRQNLTPEQIGDVALKNVVHLPFGFVGNNGALFGVEPDGVGIAPDKSFAIVAHEANQRAKHLAGFSVLDLRNGLENITAQSYSAFDVDPSLLANTGLAAVPIVAPGAPYPTDANKLPRLDVASAEIVQHCGQTVCALAIERYDPSAAQLAASPVNETRGSVLFMDVGRALNELFPVIDRLPVGVSGARIEVIDSADHGRWFFVSISNGGGTNGTVARLELQAE